MIESSDAETALIETTYRDGIYEIVLQRAQDSNAIDIRMATALETAATNIPHVASVVLIRSEGKNFCVGGAIDAFGKKEGRTDKIHGIVSAFHRAIDALSNAPVPTVCAVQGWAAGGGMGLATVCDIVVCEETTQFKPAYSAIGLTSDGGVSWQLARTLGRARTMDLMLTNGTLNAEEALRAGLVSRITPPTHAGRVAMEIAEHLSSGPTEAASNIVQLVRRAAQSGLHDQLNQEYLSMIRAASNREADEGIEAFLDKRTPHYRKC
jgi:2-(1,2-epoxy-1,2-dihydrophenyl)acetyl-CoA isomerase